MVSCRDGVLTRHWGLYFAESRKLVMLCVVGQNFPILQFPVDTSQVFKDTVSFAFNFFIDTIHRTDANVSKKANWSLWRD